MKTPSKSAFKGVTELRPALHGPLLAAQDQKFLEEFHLLQLEYCAEMEPYPVEFEATLEKYNIHGADERAFLLDLASHAGWHDVFLWTVIAASWGRSPDEALTLDVLHAAFDHVRTTIKQNGLVSKNGLPSTPRKGWVVLNVLECPLKRFERGMGGAAS